MIKKCNPPPLTAYDNRAAAHIKMGNLSAALGDGKVMIQMAKKSATVQDTVTSLKRASY